MAGRVAASLALGSICLGLVWLSGCKRGQAVPDVDTKVFVGTWLETAQPAQSSNPRAPVIKQNRNNKREIVIKDDKTFTLRILDLAGKPLAPAQEASGTWEVKGNAALFTVQTSNLSDANKGLLPQQAGAPNPGGNMSVAHADDISADYQQK